MRAYELSVFEDREGRRRVSVRLGGQDKSASVVLTDQEIDVLANIATRAACQAEVERIRSKGDL